jgi:hypothetical protein
VPVNKLETVASGNLIPSATASWSCQSSFDPCHLSSDEEEYIILNVPEPIPQTSGCTAWELTVARLNLNSLHNATPNREQNNPNLNYYHSDPMEISITFWIPDIMDWRRTWAETHSQYADLSNVVRCISSIMSHGVGVETRFYLGQNVIG